MMNEKQKGELVDAWIRYYKSEITSDLEEDPPNFWAFEKLDALTFSDPEEAWSVILEILDREVGDRVIGNLAAGPLEELLGNHGEAFIKRVEERSNKDSRFRNLLGGVWQNNIADDIWKRVRAVSGPSW